MSDALFHANIGVLLAEAPAGEINAASFPSLYQKRFGEPVILVGGEKMRQVLQRAAAAGVCIVEDRPLPKGRRLAF